MHYVLVGGTATGKKVLSAELHRRHGWPVLSMDSMKVYRGMDIGTDKPTPELRDEIPFELLDLVGHDEGFNAGLWVEHAKQSVKKAEGSVLFAGGTPLYLRLLVDGMVQGPRKDDVIRGELEALWDEEGEASVRGQLAAVDPEMEQRLLPGDRKRVIRSLEVYRLTGRPFSRLQDSETVQPIPGEFRIVALRREQKTHDRRIEERVERMFKEGLVGEVETLQGIAPFASEPGRAIGYLEGRSLLTGEMSEAEAVQRVAQRTRRLVRKQHTFLRSFKAVQWVDIGPDDATESMIPQVEGAFAV
ncbi:MAG: tRNA (adenosine(37)-N6)-dimethylallyltransferase MiaA [Planctomycetota bacterium]|nr:tRNA (adenosine(37)-N6)-dimethylallyltransferase MiaA [Planctomycetota bacterium]